MQWLEQGVFDALSKKYLSTVLLEVYEVIDQGGGSTPAGQNGVPLETQRGESTAPEGPHEGDDDVSRRILEVFSFSVDYPSASSGPKFTMSRGKKGRKGKPEPDQNRTRNGIKQSTSDVLVQLMELASTLAPLPANRVVSMKLLYTSATPEDYEPPMFRAADDKSTGSNCWFENRPLQLSPGKVCTPYHEMLIHIKTTVGTKELVDDTSCRDTRSPMKEIKNPEAMNSSGQRDEIEDNSESRVIDLAREFGTGRSRKAKTQDKIEDDESDVVAGVRSPRQAMDVDVGVSTLNRGGNNVPSALTPQQNFGRKNEYGLKSSIEQAAKDMQDISLGNYQGSQRVRGNGENKSRVGASVNDWGSRPLASPPALNLGPSALKRPFAEPKMEVNVESPFGKKRPPLPQKRPSSLDQAHSQATTAQPVRSARVKVSEPETYIYQKAKRVRRNTAQKGHNVQRYEEEKKQGQRPDDDIVSACV